MTQMTISLVARLASVLIVLIILVGNSAAQSPDKIIKQAIKAMTNGKGEKALREVRSRQASGKITNPRDGSTGLYQMSASQPNLFTEAFNLGGLEFSSGYNGKSSWTRDSRDGLRTLTGQASRDFQTEARYRTWRWLDYKKDKSKLTFAGQTSINGQPANTLALVASTGRACIRVRGVMIRPMVRSLKLRTFSR